MRDGILTEYDQGIMNTISIKAIRLVRDAVAAVPGIVSTEFDGELDYNCVPCTMGSLGLLQENNRKRNDAVFKKIKAMGLVEFRKNSWGPIWKFNEKGMLFATMGDNFRPNKNEKEDMRARRIHVLKVLDKEIKKRGKK